MQEFSREGMGKSTGMGSKMSSDWNRNRNWYMGILGNCNENPFSQISTFYSCTVERHLRPSPRSCMGDCPCCPTYDQL